MRSVTSLVALCLLFAALAAAQPVVNTGGVLNAAGYGLDLLPNAGVAQGSIFVVFGNGMGPAQIERPNGFPLQTKLAGTSIQVTVGSATVDAIPLYSSAGQVAALLPSRTPTGNGTLTLTYSGRAGRPVPITVVPSNLGIFTRNQAGTGPGVIQNYVSPAEAPFNSPIQAAQPGQVMILWGTGLGPVTVDETKPPGAVGPNTDVEVWVGGRRANVEYKGRAPEYAGLDQINFRIPQDAPTGCYVPVAVKAGGVVSNFASIAIAAHGKICSDPNGLPAADLQRIANGDTLNLAWLQLLRFNLKVDLGTLGAAIGQADIGWGELFRWNADTIGSSDALLSFGGTALGTCTASTFGRNGFPLSHPARLDAGKLLSLSGPNGTIQMPRNGIGMYEKNAIGITMSPPLFGPGKKAAYLVPGAYTISGSGIQAAGSIPDKPQPLTWTNFDAITTIDRTQPLTITWTGGDPQREYVLVGGSTSLPNLMSTQAGVMFGCLARADAGSLVIPQVVLSALAATPADQLSGALVVGRTPLLDGVRFSGNGIDAGYFVFTELNGKNVTYQ